MSYAIGPHCPVRYFTSPINEFGYVDVLCEPVYYQGEPLVLEGDGSLAAQAYLTHREWSETLHEMEF